MSIPAEAIDQARQTDSLEVARRYTVLKRIAANEWAGSCPSPSCGGDDRFRLNPKKQAFLCRQCGAKGKGSIDIVMLALGVGFAEAVEELAGPASTPTTQTKPREPERKPSLSPEEERLRDLKSAARMVSQIVPVAGTAGEQYLRDIRKIDTSVIGDVLERTDAIGWHPAVYFNQPDPAKEHHELHGQRFGAIIAILTDPVTAKPTGAISRTYLRPDLTKIGKAKNLAGSGIVRLSLDEDVLLGLHLVEGLETGLYAMAKDFRPLWATGSTSLMAAFPVLSGIECLTFFADRDRNEAGERAAKTAAARWQAAGREVHALRLRDGFGDLNDVELRRRAE
jgi:DNA primase